MYTTTSATGGGDSTSGTLLTLSLLWCPTASIVYSGSESQLIVCYIRRPPPKLFILVPTELAWNSIKENEKRGGGGRKGKKQEERNEKSAAPVRALLSQPYHSRGKKPVDLAGQKTKNRNT